MAPAVATYEPRDPSRTVLYKVIAEHLETFLASFDADPDAKRLPDYVQRKFYDYLQCGILAHGFLRLGCDTCKKEVLLAFSCKRRGFCPSCAGRRMAQTAPRLPDLVECVIPWVPTRQWVVSVPIPLRYWMSSSKELTAKIHTILRTTISQYYVNQAVKRGVERQKVQPGSVTFIQRWRWSVLGKMPMGISFTRSQGRGLTARPASHCRRWNFWRSWQRSSLCRESTSYATLGVWRHTASCVGQLSRRRANRVWMGVRPAWGRLAGAGRGC